MSMRWRLAARRVMAGDLRISRLFHEKRGCITHATRPSFARPDMGTAYARLAQW